MTIRESIASLIKGDSLTEETMQASMHQIMTGQASDAQIGAFLATLAAKGESNSEVIGATKAMRGLANKVECTQTNLTDIVGTGGDSAKIFNVSTASAFIAATAGATIAKHGNRSITSSSGSADVLEAAGIRLDLSAVEVGRCVDEIGIGFMFAVNHHSAMKHAIGPRKELAVRTIFNLLGPLTNPAFANHGLVGVFSEKWLPTFAEVLREVGGKHFLCVHSEDGLDELSIAGNSYVCELRNGEIKEYSLRPEDVGLESASLDGLRVDSAEESLAMIKAAYSGKNKAAADMLALNAGAAIYAADLCGSIIEGVEMAQDAMASGLALQKMKDLADFTQLLKQP